MKDFFKKARKLGEKIKERDFKKIYGIPKNGMIIALFLEKFGFEVILNEKEIDEKTAIVDDIFDSGKTFEDLKKRTGLKNLFLFCIFLKNYAENVFFIEKKGGWIDIPFEKEKTFEDLTIRFLEKIGENPNREGLKKTPKRFKKAFQFLTKGYEKNPDDILTFFKNESCLDQIVGLKDIEFFSMCEHHLLPFFGKAHIFYIPDEKIVGISKLARILEIFSRRLQNQERMTKQICDLIETKIKPKGVAVVVEARHLCMISRGIEKNATMKTSDIRGLFFDNEKARNELFQLIR